MPETTARLLTRLPDRPFDSPGLTTPLRMFSSRHLRWQNRFAHTPDGQLTRRLRVLAHQDRDRGYALADHVEELAAALEEGRPADRHSVGWMIRRGHLLGLGAAWGTEPAADLLWAASARALDLHGVEHLNDLP